MMEQVAAELAPQHRSAHPPDFSEFVRQHAPALLRTAWLLTGEVHLAEDLMQTALAKTWPHWQRVARGESPHAYLRQVMVRTYGAWWRRRWNGEIPTEQLPDIAVSGLTETVLDQRLDLRRALDQLPKKQRLVVVLRYYDDLPEAQVAALLGCSVGTVKSQAFKGLAALRTVLHDQTTLDKESR